MSPVVLASTSPYRLALLRNAGIHAEGAAPQCDEHSVTDVDPVRRALLRAELKARSIARPDAFVIGADQVAHIDGEPFGKPRDPADHRARLRKLRGRPHTLSVGVCIRAPVAYGGAEHSFADHSTLRFRADLSDDELDAYVATGEGSGCAGGYAAEGLGAHLIEHIDGDFTNVIGLPLYRVITLLRAIGWRPVFPAPALGPPP
jgi:septum formation protein